MTNEELEKIANDLAQDVEAHCWADNYKTYKAKNRILEVLLDVHGSTQVLERQSDIYKKALEKIIQEKLGHRSSHICEDALKEARILGSKK